MSFEALQRERLLEAWLADLPGSTTPHVVVALPSYSVDRVLYEHYGERIAPLENRYIYSMLLARAPTTRLIYLSSLPVSPEIIAGYTGLVDPATRAAVELRSWVVTPEDSSRRPLAEKLLDRGDLIDEIRRTIGDEPALIEPWNVTESEAALAVALGVPANGADPRHRRLATKSNGRRILQQAGVPVPAGIEDVRSPADVARAIATLQGQRPGMRQVVVKLDDSVAGDGNVILSVPASNDGPASAEAVSRSLPEWYTASLRDGGVVEERIEALVRRLPSRPPGR